MPLGKTRLPKVQSNPEAQQPMEGFGTFAVDAGKRTGKFVGGMVGFYGNVMDGAVKRIKEHKSQVQEPPFG